MKKAEQYIFTGSDIELIRVFGITGTNGKTTASWMLRSILDQECPCSLIGTIEYLIKDSIYTPKNTTPGKETLRKLFSEMKRQDVSQCVMEVSSHGIDQGRIDDIKFSGVGFTNLSRDHLDYHKTMEKYYQVKKKLFLQDNVQRTINLDDEYGMRMYRELLTDSAISALKGYSMESKEADYYGRIRETSIVGTQMDFYECGKYLGSLDVKIPGKHFASDALLAASMARQSGMDFSVIRQGLQEMEPVAGRMEQIGSPDDTLGIVDYAHTPDSLEHLLKTVNEFKRGKLLCVFGCGGFRDKGKRYLMGKIAGYYSDYCIITNDNPRGEPPENIAEAIEEGLHPTGCEYSVILNRYQAIKRAVSLADKWDIIVVAGKGHETYQISGSGCIPFDDRKVLKELLEKKYEKTYNAANRDRYRRSSD